MLSFAFASRRRRCFRSPPAASSSPSPLAAAAVAFVRLPPILVRPTRCLILDPLGEEAKQKELDARSNAKEQKELDPTRRSSPQLSRRSSPRLEISPAVIKVVKPKKPYGPAADIWSLGCTVLEMLTRQVPYPGMEWPSVIFKVGKGEKPPIPSHLSKDARDFITQCVQANPTDRPSASQLLEHPFVRRSLPFLGPGSDYSSSPGNNRWN